MSNKFENFLIVKEDKTLRRDPHSKAIVNVDRNAYKKYMRKYNYVHDQKREIDDLKSEVKELKEMLKILIERT
jgi:hypothetical protein